MKLRAAWFDTVAPASNKSAPSTLTIDHASGSPTGTSLGERGLDVEGDGKTETSSVIVWVGRVELALTV